MKGLNKDNLDISIASENVPKVQQVSIEKNYEIEPNLSELESLQMRYQKEFEKLSADNEEVRLFLEQEEKDYLEKESKNKITNFLKQLRESDELMIKIFNNGSCYKLTKILKSLYPTAEPLYSREDGHWITRIDDSYYDIGGRVSKEYVSDKDYEYLPQFEASADIPTYSNNVGVVYSKYE